MLAAALASLLALGAAAAPRCDDPKTLVQTLAAALESYRSSNACGQTAALGWLNKLFPKGVSRSKSKAKKPSDLAPIAAEMLDAAVDEIEARLAAKDVKVRCAEARGNADASGYWNPQVDSCESSFCGALELGPRKMLELSRSSFQTEMELRAADDFANTVTHEAFHAFDHYFRRVYGAERAADLGGLNSDFQYRTFFTGCTLFEVTSQGRAHAPIAYTAPNEMYDESVAGYEQAARMAAHQMQVCFSGRPNPYYAAILGDPATTTCGR